MCKVLLVEDEEIERIALKSIILDNLSTISIVGEASNGYEAISIIKRNEVDFVFMDINIPGINGLDVVRFIKLNYPKVVIIIITAYDTFEVAHSALKLKVDDFLLKPVKPSLIIETLEQYFNELNESSNMSLCQSHVKQLRNEILEKSYSSSIDTVRSFVFEIYENEDYFNNISKIIMEFNKGVTNICKEIGLNCTNNVIASLKSIESGQMQYYSRYEMFTKLTEAVNIIFDEIISRGRGRYSNEKDIKKILNYIDKNIRNGISLEDVSDYVNMSIYYLSKVFKKEMNMNFINYITDKKMEIAKEMLVNTDEPVVNIAIELSYNEANYFSKSFKSKVGMTPTEYRERYGKKGSE